MPDTRPIQDLEDGIHSIFGFIQRTAEPAEGGLTWETIDYANQPQHEISVFNGVGGISFFLVDYYQRYGNPDALALSQGAIDWCANFKGPHHKRGIHMGQTGAALAALHRAVALGESAALEFSRANARFILSEPPGPVTDFLGGEASNGLYLLKLWAHTGEAEFLRGAERCGTWLEALMVRDNHGTYCHPHATYRERNWAKIQLGVAHGLSGVAHFFVGLADATKSERWATLARELFATITRYAQPARGGLNWPMSLDEQELPRCQWSHGAAGIGLTFLAAYRVLGDGAWLETAKQAAEATFGYGDFRQNYTQCTGLAGGGELLLETYRATGDRRWYDRAVDFARQCVAYRESTPDGDAWPTDGKGLYSADFDYGAAGAGHFLLRVCSEGQIPMPLM